MLRVLLHAASRVFLTLAFGFAPARPLEDAQCIVAANHNTHLDTLALCRLFPLRRVNSVKVVAARDYFDHGIGGFFGRMAFNLILLDRQSSRTSLEPVEEALRQGFSVILFPEGTRGEPGVMRPFKSGIGKLALDFPELPVYPVCLHGIEKTLPKGGRLPVPFTIRTEVLPPVFGKDFLHAGQQGRKLLTARLEEHIRAAGAGSACRA